MAKIGHIYAYGDIAAFQSSEAQAYSIVSLTGIRDQVAALGDVEEYVLHINSGGGDLYEGYAIYDYLLSLGKKITTKAEGFVASCATVLFLAGSVREITNLTVFLIHNPRTGTYGDSAEMQRMADELAAEEEKIAKFYAKNTGELTYEKILEIMAVDAPMAVEDVVKYKFATALVEPIKASFKLNQFNPMSKLTKYLAEAAKELTRMGVKNVKLIAQTTEETNASTTVTVKTTDGTELNIEQEGTAPATGDVVTKTDGTAVADGEYTLEDGAVIKVTGGKIETYTPKPAASHDTATVAALKKELDDLKVANKALSEKVTDMETQAETDAKDMEAIAAHLKGLKTNFAPPKKEENFAQETPAEKAERERKEASDKKWRDRFGKK